MTTTPDVIDGQLALDGFGLRDAGAELAAAAVPTWTEQAAAWIGHRNIGEQFTSEDLTDAIGLPRTDVGKDRNNAVGAALLRASKGGLIVRVRYEAAKRRESHGAVIGVWVRVCEAAA